MNRLRAASLKLRTSGSKSTPRYFGRFRDIPNPETCCLCRSKATRYVVKGRVKIGFCTFHKTAAETAGRQV